MCRRVEIRAAGKRNSKHSRVLWGVFVVWKSWAWKHHERSFELCWNKSFFSGRRSVGLALNVCGLVWKLWSVGQKRPPAPLHVLKSVFLHFQTSTSVYFLHLSSGYVTWSRPSSVCWDVECQWKCEGGGEEEAGDMFEMCCRNKVPALNSDLLSKQVQRSETLTNKPADSV